MAKDRKPNPLDSSQDGLFQAPLSNTTGFGVDFDPNIDDAFINERGDQVIHKMAVSCPSCRKENRSEDILGPHVLTTCPTCEGMGWIYRNPRKIMAMVTGIQSNRRWIDMGLLNPGDSSMSVSPKLYPPISDFDLITFTWPQPLDDGQIIVRRKDFEREKELTRKDPSKRLKENEDRLLYNAAQALWVEDDNGKRYYENTDFVFDGKVVRWLNMPARGTRISMKYQCYYDWICFSSPFERRDSGKSLGARVALRKVHIAFTGEDPHQPDGILGDTILGGNSSVKV